MLPGKSYSVDDLLQIVRRRFWFVLVPLAVGGAIAAHHTRSQPNVFASETIIAIQPQQVAANYVQPTIAGRIEDRLQVLRTTILSRTRLERIIEEYDLYPDQRRVMPMDDVVAAMRREIEVDPRPGNTFRVLYRGADPVVVMKVTDSLAQLFINETLLDRRILAEGTNQFLDSQLAEARSKLEEHERRLAAWKVAHAGELPTQYEANLQQVTNTQMNLRDVRASINQDQTRRLELERQLADLQNPAAAATAVPDPSGTSMIPVSGGTASQLSAAEAQVAQFEQRGYKAGHPDLDLARRRVRDLQARLEAEMASVVAPPTGPRAGASPSDLGRLRRMDDVRGQMALLDKQIAKNVEEERRLVSMVADAQRRADAIPARESEYIALTRDYETLRDTYMSLLANKQQSQIAANLESRQAGEQFKLVDPAQLPVRPISPNRPRDILIGLLGGALFGVLLIAGLEQHDRSLKTDVDVASVLDVPVLAVVPVMKSERDMRRALWSRVLVSAGLGGVVVWCLVFVASVAAGH